VSDHDLESNQRLRQRLRLRLKLGESEDRRREPRHTPSSTAQRRDRPVEYKGIDIAIEREPDGHYRASWGADYGAWGHTASDAARNLRSVLP
jgi:hypothetical protein